MKKRYTIAVAGTGYVGLSISVLLAQHHHVTAVDIIADKVALITKENHQYKMNISKNIWQKRTLI